MVHLINASDLGYTREATYRYDALGRRISKTVRHTKGTTATTHYGWDGDRIVREETDNQRTTVVYEPGSFMPMLRIDDTQQGQVLSAYITDALGTPMQLVTPNVQPRWLAEPDDWAAVKNQRAVRNVTQPIRFQGQWHDEESGLYYNRHRYYDPQQGRYISQDPIGLNGGANLYGYVTNPTGMVDPRGLEGAHPWNYAANKNYSVLRNSSDALAHYYGGNGSPAELCQSVKDKIINHPSIQDQIERNMRGEGEAPYRVDIDLTWEGWDTFHIGRMKVEYTETCSGNSCTTTFTGPIMNTHGEPDGFEDPLNIGMEAGGTPYKYETFEWSVTYPKP